MNRSSMTRYWAIFVITMLSACPATHDRELIVGARCDDLDGGVRSCPEGTYCALFSAATGARTCRLVCAGGTPGSSRCESGEICVQPSITYPSTEPFTCWPGRDLAEDAECRLRPYDCARGLLCARDLSGSDPTATCQPVCNTSADCTASGERCIFGQSCAVPCNPADASTCPDGSVCRVDYCEWAPRAADCDRDGTAECALGEICDTPLEGVTCYTPVEYLAWRCPPGVCP